METPFKKIVFGLVAVLAIGGLVACNDAPFSASTGASLQYVGFSDGFSQPIVTDKRTGCAFIKNYVEGDYIYTALPDPTGKQVGCKQNGAMSLDDYLKINPEVK